MEEPNDEDKLETEKPETTRESETEIIRKDDTENTREEDTNQLEEEPDHTADFGLGSSV